MCFLIDIAMLCDPDTELISTLHECDCGIDQGGYSVKSPQQSPTFKESRGLMYVRTYVRECAFDPIYGLAYDVSVAPLQEAFLLNSEKGEKGKFRSSLAN